MKLEIAKLQKRLSYKKNKIRSIEQTNRQRQKMIDTLMEQQKEFNRVGNRKASEKLSAQITTIYRGMEKVPYEDHLDVKDWKYQIELKSNELELLQKGIGELMKVITSHYSGFVEVSGIWKRRTAKYFEINRAYSF